MVSLIRNSLVRLQVLIVGEEGQALAQTGLVFGLVAIMCMVALTVVGLVVSGNLYDFAMAIDGRSPSLTLN